MDLFCKIIAGEIPAYKIFEDDLVMAFLDINPKATGHTLVIPKKHLTDYKEIDNNLFMHILNVAQKLEAKLTESLGASGCSFVWNYGSAQQIKHFHLHLIPEYEKKLNLKVEDVYEKLR